MSDLANAARLRQATSQLPAAAYCDPRLFEAERRHLFARAPGTRAYSTLLKFCLGKNNIATKKLVGKSRLPPLKYGGGVLSRPENL